MSLAINEVFVIVPCFNEASVIRETVAGLLKVFVNVVIVDDGSKDDCAIKLHGLPVYYIKHLVNLGQGAAIQTGIDFALQMKAQYLVTFDADQQHLVSDAHKMLVYLKSTKTDFVFGSRFTDGGLTNATLSRIILLQFSRYVNFLISGALLSDCNNGLRVFTATAARKIRIRENKRTHSADFIYQVKKKGLTFCECPVTINYSAYSKSKGIKNVDGIKILLDLLLYKFFK